MRPKISIIIVTYNSGPLTVLCLWSLKKAGLNNSEVIVIDNAGNDKIPDTLKQQFPFIRLIRNTENEGFGRACNRGMAMAQGDIFLLLNPDTIVPENFESTLLDFFEKHPSTGAMGVNMITGDGSYLPESKRDLPTPSASIWRFTGLAHLFPHSPRFASYYAGHLSPSQEGIIEVLSGAFMAVTRRAIESAGAFDPRFFLYGEDIDLSWRIHQAGFQTWYNPHLQIIHFKGESTTKNPHHARIFYKAMRQFYRKHFDKRYHPVFSFTVLAAIEGLTILAAIKHLLGNHLPHKLPPRFCLRESIATEQLFHLNNQLPFDFVSPEYCNGKKTPRAILINTLDKGPGQIIKEAKGCLKNKQQLFIYHPPTGHLFLVANQHKRSKVFDIPPQKQRKHPIF